MKAFPFVTWLRINMKKCFTIVILILVHQKFCEGTHQKDSIVEVKEEPGPGGLWQTKMSWKAHWVMHWETRKVWIPIWRKVWGPVQQKEWIPYPKVPESWKVPATTWTQPPP